MTRLIVHVEGQTEELFVNETLAPHLYKKGFTLISARLIGNARLRANRGGIKGWDSVKRDIQRHLEQDRGCYVTTMVDYYALPQSGQKAWPGRHEATDLPHDFKAQHIENLLQQEVIALCNSHTAINRFIPYIALHEFEALLFSDCHAFASSLNCFEVESQLYTIRNSFQTPEHINDSPETAPSKRIEEIFPRYEKLLFGNIAALEIGIDSMRAQCPHFSDWLTRLESVA